MYNQYSQDEWNENTLAGLGALSRGKSKHRPRNDPSLFGGSYPFIQTSEIKHANFYINSYSETYNDTGLAQSKLWPKNTLCVTIAANIAETALLGFPACFPDSIVGFIENPEKSDVRFIKYALDHYKKKYQQRSKGAAQDNLSLEKIESLKLKVPPVLLQQKIANSIFTYDNLIENNEKRIKILKEMAQRLYTEWFVKFKFPGYETVKMVDSPLGKIPEGWEAIPVSRLADFVNGYPFKPAELGDNGLPIVKIPELRSGVLDKTPRNSGENIPKKYLIKNGDILFSWSATLIVNIWNSGDALLNQHLFKVNPKQKLYKSYVFYLLKLLVESLSKHVVGATMQHLRRNTVVGAKALLPAKIILELYEESASTIIQLIGNIQIQNQILQKTRDLLIPQLVTGKRELKSLTISKPNNKDLFKDAIIFSYYIKSISTPQFNPTHLRAVKSIYFANRFLGKDPTQQYSVQQFGPYDPKSKYAGGESIALKKEYVERIKGGFKPGDNISEINNYTYDELAAIDKVLIYLKYKKDTELELLNTIDYAVYDTLLKNQEATPNTIFKYIQENPVWSTKISRFQLSVEKVKSVMDELRNLARQGLSYPTPKII